MNRQPAGDRAPSASRRPAAAASAKLDRRLVALAAVLFTAYAYFYQGGGWNQNSRFALIRAVIEHGTLRVDDTLRFEGRNVTGDFAPSGGHVYSDKAPGLAFVALLPVALAHPFVSEPASRAGIARLSYIATVCAAGLPTLLTALLLLGLARELGAGAGAATFAALVFGLGTPAWCYATVLYGHALATACLFAAFTAAVALRNPSDRRRDWVLAAVVGGAAGWATITEYTAGVAAAIIALLALLHAGSDRARRRRVFIGVGASALTCAAILALYNQAAFGSPLNIGYTTVPGFEGMRQGFMGVSYPRIEVFGELLVGRFRGLLYLAPVLALSPIGFEVLIRNRATRLPGITAAAIALYYLLLNSSYFYWDGGWSYGPRHMSPALPFLALALAALWSQSKRPLHVMMVVLALYGGGLTLVAVSTTAQPPDDYKRPVSDLLWPNFKAGNLAINQQAFVEPAPRRERDPIAHSWNLGQKIGLNGHMSLLPLFLVWAAVVVGWVKLENVDRQGSGIAAVAEESGARTKVGRQPGPREEAPSAWLSPRVGWIVGISIVAFSVLLLLSKLAFSPVPWPDSPAYYLPGLELLSWPPRWRFHCFAPFFPSYDEANFNTLPGLAIVMAAGSRLGVGWLVGATLWTKLIGVTAFALFAATLLRWTWRQGRWVAVGLTAAFLFDPMTRWSALSARPDVWVCLLGFWALLLLEAPAESGQMGFRHTVSIGILLGVAALFHFEAIFLVPAVAVGLWDWRRGRHEPWPAARSWMRDSLSVAVAALIMLSPWLVFAWVQRAAFHEQISAIFSNLSHANSQVSTLGALLGSVWQDMGVPGSWPMFLILGKFCFWILVLNLSWLTLRHSVGDRIALAAMTAFYSSLYLWTQKEENWYAALCHFMLWVWVGAVVRYSVGRGSTAALSWLSAAVGLAVLVWQLALLPAGYSWANYRSWVDCVDNRIGEAATRLNGRVSVWQPTEPDLLVELAERHQDYDLYRNNDFERLVNTVEWPFIEGSLSAFVLSRELLALAGEEPYSGSFRTADEVPLRGIYRHQWLRRMRRELPGRWSEYVCQRGPFWAVVATRNQP